MSGFQVTARASNAIPCTLDMLKAGKVTAEEEPAEMVSDWTSLAEINGPSK